MSDRYELSRRKTLAGLATIGVAGAGAGLGTSALFSDEESFEGNTITAGTLDMSVTAEVVAANQYWEDKVDLEELTVTADGEAVTGLEVEDVKPGDWGIICFTISVADNPAYVRTEASNLVNHENGLTEPEAEVDGSGGDPGQGNGELQDAMLAEVYGSYDDSDDSNPPRSHLSPDGGDPVAPEGSTVQETYDAFEDGVLMRDDQGDLLEVGSVEDEEAAEWCLLLWLPREVGNEVQGDSFTFDLSFGAEQVRNNNDPFNSTD